MSTVVRYIKKNIWNTSKLIHICSASLKREGRSYFFKYSII